MIGYLAAPDLQRLPHQYTPTSFRAGIASAAMLADLVIDAVLSESQDRLPCLIPVGEEGR